MAISEYPILHEATPALDEIEHLPELRMERMRDPDGPRYEAVTLSALKEQRKGLFT